jgi:predicted transposase YbfD/YdcC
MNDTPSIVAVQLLKLCENVPDFRRSHRQKHALPKLLAIALMGFLCGYTDWVHLARWAKLREDWLNGLLDLPNGVPSHDTFARVFRELTPDDVESFFGDALQLLSSRLELKSNQQIAIDGKAMKGTRDSLTNKVVTMVSAWATEHGLTLTSESVDEKSNEITAIPELLKRLNLTGNLVSIDAVGCQKEIAQQICNQGGDYFLAVKENQPRLFEDIDKMAEEALENDYADLSQLLQEERSHGRDEMRFGFVMTDLEKIRDLSLWSNLKSVVVIVSERVEQEKRMSEVRYFISSRKLTGEEGLRASRNHWGIENQCHWVLDVLWKEDACQNSNRVEAENMSRFRKLALNIIRAAPMKEKTITGRCQILHCSDSEMIRILQNALGF